MSRLVPDSPAYDVVRGAAEDGLPVAVPATVWSEVAYGVTRGVDQNPKLATTYEWVRDLLGAVILQPLPLTFEAADVGGGIRALQPFPPTDGPRRKGSKSEQRVGWVLDLLAAATAWVHGCDIVTRNRHDFDRIAALLPAADADSRLEIAGPDFD